MTQKTIALSPMPRSDRRTRWEGGDDDVGDDGDDDGDGDDDDDDDGDGDDG